MTIEAQIEGYIADQPAAKRDEMRALHQRMLRNFPGCRLWFLDGRNEDGKIVSNPNIGYGTQVMKNAGGKTREFYQIGLSANTTGISIYIIGVEDKSYLKRTFGEKLGKASITGYCVKFRTLKDIDTDTLDAMIRFGFEARD